MTAINRNPDSINEPFDVIVVGGGIYGACTLLEASRRGLRALLIERDDFGGATTWNSLRIVHGGLRYLQHADLGRFRRSVAEQTWWLHNFPDLVEPLSCLMPLYNFGLKRTDVMRAALARNQYAATGPRQAASALLCVDSERQRWKPRLITNIRCDELIERNSIPEASATRMRRRGQERDIR